jgi:hypothetical protein
MAAGRIVFGAWMPAVDANGVPIPNARIFFYDNETTILKSVYANQALTIPLPNPVSANSSGQFPDIWGDDAEIYSATIDAPYGPPGTPFTYDNVVPGQNTGGGGGGGADKLDISGANIPPPSEVAPSGALALRQSQNLFFVTPEDFGGVSNDDTFDNSVAITRAETYLKALPEGGALVFGEGRDYYFKSTIGGARNRLVWRGSRTRLIYNGASTTTDLLVFGDGINAYREQSVSGVELCSLTNMTAGSGVRTPFAVRSDFDFDNINGQDWQEANGNTLYHGFWAEKVDNVRVMANAINAKADGFRVNGALGDGPKADCWLMVGKIGSCAVGVRMGGGFGGLYLTPNTTMINNRVNFIVDRTLTAEGNREFFATGAIFDVSLGDDLENEANVIIDDDGGLRANFTGCWFSAGQSHGVWIKALQGVLTISGCRIVQMVGDGFRTSVAGTGFTLINGCQITSCGGWGINGLVENYAVSIGACEIGANTEGDINPEFVNSSRTTNGAARFLGTAEGTQFQLDANSAWRFVLGNPRFQSDVGDYYGFDRALNKHIWAIGGQEALVAKPGYAKVMGGDYYSPGVRMTGTADGSGIALVAHSDASLPRKIKRVSGFYYLADGSSWSFPGAANITASYIAFQAHAPAAGCPFVIDYEYYETSW